MNRKTSKNLTKLTTFFIFALSIIFVFSSTYAQNIKIAYVDAQRIITDSKKGQEAQKKLKDLEAKKRQELERKRQEIQKLEDELQKQMYTLSEEAKREKQDEIDRAKLELKRMAEDADRELNKLEKQLLKKIDDEVMEIIRQLGKEKNYTIIFGIVPSVILYVDKSIDITDEVIKRYDAKK